MIRQPLIHFLAAGVILYFASEVHRERTDFHRIVVTPERAQQLANRYELQFGARPDARTLNALVEQDIGDEMLFRQGLALKLQEGDEIVRRRVVQKMQFLLEDLHAPAEPTEAELRGWYDANAGRYFLPVRVTFTHIFFASGQGENLARARAETALQKLIDGSSRAPDLGDPFPDLSDFSVFEPEQLYRLFGRTEFSAAALSAPVERWTGPLRSAYGWHLIHIQRREAAKRQPLADVLDRVRADYLLDAQERSSRAALADLARDFTVVRDERQGVQ